MSTLLHRLFESPLVDRLGWTLLHSLWQGAAVAALLSLVLMVLHRYGPRPKYTAGVGALLVLAVLPVITFLVVRPPALQTESSPTYELQADRHANSLGNKQNMADGVPPDATRRVAIAPLADALPADHGDNVTSPATLGESPSDPSTSASKIVANNELKPVLEAAITDSPRTLHDALPWAVAVWAIGVLALSIWNLGGWIAVQRLKRSATELPDPSLQAVAVRLAKKLSLSGPAMLRLSTVAQSPMVVGVLRPVILLPASLVTGLSQAHMEALLAHELAHIVRRDYLVNLLQAAVETLLFYHPATWWISARVRAEREHCCDDMAVAAVQNKKEYVRALAAVAAAGISVPALALGATSGPLVGRVRRLLGRPDPTSTLTKPSRWVAAAALMGLSAVAAILVSGPLGRLEAADNTSTTQPTSQRVLLVTKGNYYLEQGIRTALPNFDLKVMDAATYDTNGSAGAAAVVFDDIQPKQSPGLPALYFGALPPGSKLQPDEELTNSNQRPKPLPVTDWASDHQLLKGVALNGVFGDDATPVRSSLPGDWEVLARSGTQPLLLARPAAAGARELVVTFSSGRSNWPFRPGFSPFLKNAVQWLNPVAGATPAIAPSTKPIEPRRINLRLVNSETGRPVTDTRAGIMVDEAWGQIFSFDERGEAQLPYPPNVKRLRIDLNASGFISRSVSLGAANPRIENRKDEAIPEKHIILLRPGIKVSGTVVDEVGQPVAGVWVTPSFDYDDPARPGVRSYSHGDAVTDAQGRWEYGGAPPESEEASMFARHPDFVMESFSQSSRDPAAFQAMRKGTHVSTIRRGVSVAGTVLDAAGKPLAGAEVGPDGFDLISCTKADLAGRFRLRGVAPGDGIVVARADGFAPQVRQVKIQPNMKGVDFKLEKGGVLRAKVVNERGEPVAGASVAVQSWGNANVEKSRSRSLGYHIGQTGADGRLVWTGAPTGPLKMSVYKNGLPSLDNLATTADQGEEYRWTLQSYPKVEGTVGDEDGKPIAQGKVRLTATREDKTSSTIIFPIEAGKFAGTVQRSGDNYVLRTEVEGYLPAESPVLRKAEDDSAITHAFRLKKGVPTTGVVLQSNGLPAAGAEVMMVEGYHPGSVNGVLDRYAKTQNPTVATDAAGKFSLPARGGTKPSELLIIHETGWAEGPHSGGTLQEPLKLRDWCTVSGTLMRGDKPWANQEVSQRVPISVPNGRGGYGNRPAFRSTTRTDAAGRFELVRVVDGDTELTAGGQTLPLKLEPGDQISEVKIGGSGQPVIGIVKVPEAIAKQKPPLWSGNLRRVEPAFDKPAKWEALPKEERQRQREAFEQTPEYLRYASQVSQIEVSRAVDGSFRMEDVPPGDYTLFLSVQAPTPGEPNNYRALAMTTIPVKVLEVPGGKSDQPLDLGNVELKAVNHDLKVGDVAPPIHAATFDGKRLQLADYKGKYVLLDFWATWCGPCIAEQPMLRELHNTHSTRGHLVIVGLSTDTHSAAPAKFAQTRQLPWVQGHVGTSSGSSAQQDYGVQGIPSTWLIGPDGKIIAKDLHGDELKAAIGKAMAGDVVQ